MSFKIYRGKTKLISCPVTPSTALTKDTLVEFTSGKIAAADADETSTNVFGVLVGTIASTDSDYANDRNIPIRIPVERHVVWEADATGTFAATDVGAEFGISDSGTVDKTETSTVCFKVTEFVSASKVRGMIKFNGAY